MPNSSRPQPKQNKLHTPAVLERQVRRMLADPKADSLVQNFRKAIRLLYLRNLRRQRPRMVFSASELGDDELRKSFRRETELLFGSIIRENRSVKDLLDAELHVPQRSALPNTTAFRTSTAPSSGA